MEFESSDFLKRKSQMEQAEAALVDTFPRLWWGLYSRLKEEGFMDHEALDLVKSYIQATLGKKL